MLTELRRQHILDTLQRDGQLVARSLAESLGISEDTVRRDLRELARQGALTRVHGGALPAAQAVAELQTRSTLAQEEKRALGRAAAALIAPGQVVLVDGGSSNLELVRALAPDLRATIITHSPVIASVLIEHATVEVVLIGGRLFKPSGVSVGAAAQEAILSLRADLYFMGATGVHREHGITTGDLEESHIKRALMNAAAATVLLGSSTQLGRVSPYRIAPAASLTTLLVTRAAQAELLEPLRKAGIQVELCG